MKRLQLTVRDLFWLVLVAALGCAWWLDHRRQAAANRRVTEMLYEAVVYDRRPTYVVPIGDAVLPVEPAPQ